MGQEIHKHNNKGDGRMVPAVTTNKAQTVHAAANNCLFPQSLPQKIQRKSECHTSREGLRKRNIEEEQIREKKGRTHRYACKN